MDKKRSPWLCFIWQDIRQLLGSAKFYVVVAVVVVGMLTCFGGIRDYLRETGALINPLELYVVSISNRVSLWIIYVGAVVLVCDAPFRYKGDIVRIVRTSRKMWLTGQVSFSCICILLYMRLMTGSSPCGANPSLDNQPPHRNIDRANVGKLTRGRKEHSE